jgi:hypothetical protein
MENILTQDGALSDNRAPALPRLIGKKSTESYQLMPVFSLRNSRLENDNFTDRHVVSAPPFRDTAAAMIGRDARTGTLENPHLTRPRKSGGLLAAAVPVSATSA